MTYAQTWVRDYSVLLCPILVQRTSNTTSTDNMAVEYNVLCKTPINTTTSDWVFFLLMKVDRVCPPYCGCNVMQPCTHTRHGIDDVI